MSALAGVRVLEFGSLGPVPFCAMLLADMGADVVHVARPGLARDPAREPMLRGRRMVPLDLKADADRASALDLAAGADVLLEGNRPGVMERLGLGPAACHARHPRLVYGRMTGWGQDGPLAPRAGHDINYIALSGALHAIGAAGGPPVPPLNLVGDYGGGSLYLAFGVLCALRAVAAGGAGQVVDAAMVDGSASLMTLVGGLRARGAWSDRRGENAFDGGAPWYATYATADGRYVAVGAIEPAFWAALLTGLGIAPETLPAREDRAGWPVIRARLAGAFVARTRDAWDAAFAGSDACVSPVLDVLEAAAHPHLAARGTFVTHAGVAQPAPAPRLSGTPGAIRATTTGTAAAVLAEWEARAATPA